MSGGYWKLFTVTLWKNFVWRGRFLCTTFFETVFAVVTLAVLAVIKILIWHGVIGGYDTHHYLLQTESSLVESLQRLDPTVVYTPINNFTDEVMRAVAAYNIDVTPMKSEAELMNHVWFLRSNQSEKVFGVLFDLGQEVDGFPLNITYTIRTEGEWQTELYKPEQPSEDTQHSSEPYCKHGFLGLQFLIDRAIIFNVSQLNNLLDLQFSVQSFPHPKTIAPWLKITFRYTVLVVLMISFITSLQLMLPKIVEEKATGAKDLLRTAGMPAVLHWFGWFLHGFSVNFITVTLVVLIMKLPFVDPQMTLFPGTSYTTMWMFLLLICAALTFTVFFISTFFWNSKLAFCTAVGVWLLSSTVPLWIRGTVQHLTRFVKILLTLITPLQGMMFGFETIHILERSACFTLTWETVFSTFNCKDDILSLGDIMVTLLFHCVIFGLLTLYAEAVIPGTWGVNRRWNLLRKYEFNHRKVRLTSIHEQPSILHRATIEPVRDGRLEVVIRVQELVKVYQNRSIVSGLTFDVQSGYITALLGIDHVGKTTAICIVAGMFRPSSGKVFITGLDVHEDPSKVRDIVGVCPQAAMLFPFLTVEQHLILFAMIKGMDTKQAKKAANNVMGQLYLSVWSSCLCSDLFLSTKKKLCLALALVGNPKVLLLDEPSSGLDSAERRQMWDVILAMRRDRTILLTTNSMEEADVLGDRIAILHHGRLKCYGSSMFLKKLFGSGHMLLVRKQPDCQSVKIINVVTSHISGSLLTSDTSADITFSLPLDQTEKLAELAQFLEDHKSSLKISRMGVCPTTLEQVFWTVSRQADTDNGGGDFVRTKKALLQLQFTIDDGITGFSLMTRQLGTLIRKQCKVVRRRWLLQILPVMCGTFFLFFSTYYSMIEQKVELSRPLQLTFPGMTSVPCTLSKVASSDEEGIFAQYKRLVSPWATAIESTNMAEVLMQLVVGDLRNCTSTAVVGAEFLNKGQFTQVNALFSGIPLHAAPVSLNLVTNAVLRSMNSENCSITTVNHPFPPIQELILEDILVCGLAAQFVFGLMFVVSSFLILPLEERVSGVKQQQLMTGVSPIAYWFSFLLTDFVKYLLILTPCLLSIHLWGGPLADGPVFGVLVLFFLLFALAGAVFAYLFTYASDSTTSALLLHFFVSTSINSIATYLSATVGRESISMKAGVSYCIGKLLLFLPAANLFFGLIALFDEIRMNDECSRIIQLHPSICKPKPWTECCWRCHNKLPYCSSLGWYLSLDDMCGIGVNLMMLAVDFFLYLIILLFIDYHLLEFVKGHLLRPLLWSRPPPDGRVDEDVMTEEEKVIDKVEAINAGETINHVLLVNNLVKNYLGRSYAVKGVSFGVGPGICFGVLGPNGAGKTTIFRMLTGELRPSSGKAWLCYAQLRDSMKFISMVGYCPQSNPIIPVLTGKEMLTLFANLRGIPHHMLNREVDKMLHLVGLYDSHDLRCGIYSGCNKRKLSLALAVIARPPLLLVDEPTMGLEPMGRKRVWGVLSALRSAGHTVVLSSHKMDECEALCDQVAIMVNGRFVCLGPVSHIKTRFGQGFDVTLHLDACSSPPEMRKHLKHAMTDLFSVSCLNNEQPELLKYHVDSPDIPWKLVINAMEDVRKRFSMVEYYMVTETSLEDVFLSFSKQQTQY